MKLRLPFDKRPEAPRAPRAPAASDPPRAAATAPPAVETSSQARPGLVQVPAGCTHVTHWKAASQWFLRMICEAFAEAVVEPEVAEAQVLQQPIQAGRVYPCVYLSEPCLRMLKLPPDCRYFVVIRDLRDTLVSGYYSLRYTHAVNERWIAKWRQMLNGLLERHSFARYSGGRQPGQEDPQSHYRMGIHGDWRRHFTRKVSDRFKARYNDLLVLSGYEKDDAW